MKTPYLLDSISRELHNVYDTYNDGSLEFIEKFENVLNIFIEYLEDEKKNFNKRIKLSEIK